ncbi:hypothetical protein NDU88_005775 [Pleurodeles waltl]|uniref:Uncharacterized protein n=1 Tax=Pleurodeles waltl TaxID=8319 RepID=A0AAV7WZP6_PLEWA|nr:hypothetical protein NDU88_005775 [Pleurodeles waltl]
MTRGGGRCRAQQWQALQIREKWHNREAPGGWCKLRGAACSLPPLPGSESDAAKSLRVEKLPSYSPATAPALGSVKYSGSARKTQQIAHRKLRGKVIASRDAARLFSSYRSCSRECKV